MASTEFIFENILGKTAKLVIKNDDSHLFIKWGDLVVTDISGDIGFWSEFRKMHPFAKEGTTKYANFLKQFALAEVERNIYDQFLYMQEEITEKG